VIYHGRFSLSLERKRICHMSTVNPPVPIVTIPGLPPIAFNPAIDGGASAPGMPRTGGSPHVYRLDQHTSHVRASEIELYNSPGTTLGHLMGPNTLVLPPNNDGVPQGYNPHQVSDIPILVDPHIAGGGGIIRMGELNSAAVRQARQLVDQQVPSSGDPDLNRFRVSATLAAATQFSRQQLQPAPLQPGNQLPTPDPQQYGPQQFHGATPGYSPPPPPAYPYGPPAGASQAPPPMRPGFRAIRPDPAALARLEEIPAPDKIVQFEIRGMGQFESPYHDIVFGDGIVVLVYDTRYKGHRYRPPANGPTEEPIAINIAGSQQILLVHVTGQRFVHKHCEYETLLVAEVYDPQQFSSSPAGSPAQAS
jgi:hypothetical protein